ncbi:DnaD domain-containing protein [Psychrobacillus sp. FSL K6-1267]|uniref:DnaD domain-containing protein n=1 Tax=Psychrobacillus sp. FSL K6-1267 TaxID=2921543 RepID=UPI0030F9E3F3
MTNLLLDERPLLIMPKLAVMIGLPESIFLQQLHYWTEHSNNIVHGEKWVYNSLKEWQKQFPFWSERTLHRIIKSLETKNLIVAGNYNKLAIDRTKWYRINYETLHSLGSKNPIPPNGETYRQVGNMDLPKMEVGVDKLATPLPEITSEITSKIKNNDYDEQSIQNENVISFYERNGFGTISDYIGQKIGAWIDDLSEELVVHALKLAVENNARSWKYAETILRNWYNKNLKTLTEIEAENKRREENKLQKQYKSNRFVREEKIPASFNQGETELSLEEKKRIDEEREKLLKELNT